VSTLGGDDRCCVSKDDMETGDSAWDIGESGACVDGFVGISCSSHGCGAVISLKMLVRRARASCCLWPMRANGAVGAGLRRARAGFVGGWTCPLSLLPV
jgi:hypothetical protein